MLGDRIGKRLERMNSNPDSYLNRKRDDWGAGRGAACPKCSSPASVVTDSRPSARGIRRRRACADCSHRWTTFEIVAPSQTAIALEVPILLKRIEAAAKNLTEIAETAKLLVSLFEEERQ